MSDNMVVLPGERCRKAREAMGWSTAEAARRMHLSQTYLLALEADDYERLPEATFVKGYLKNYAKLLGLPADEVANTFQQMVNEDAFDKKLELPELPSKPSLFSRPVVWLLLLALLVVGAVLSWPRGENAAEDSEVTSGLAPAGEAMNGDEGMQTDEAQFPDEGATGLPPQEAESAADDASGVSGDMPDAQADTTEPAPAAVEQEPAIDPDMLASNGLDRLVLDLSADCWMEIKDANGRVLRQGVKPAGATLRVDGKAPFTLKIGDAAAVSELFLNGEIVTLPTDSPGRVVKLTLP